MQMRSIIVTFAVLAPVEVFLGQAAYAASEQSSTTASSDEPAAEDDLEDLFNLLESEVMVTTATKSAVVATLAPSIVTVISRATIDAHGYGSIAEALRNVPGFYVIDDLVAKNVAVRGIHGGTNSWSRIIKVMIDGQPATFYTTGGYFLGPEFIPMEAVEAIEVIRGPGSALYGANAFLAVVNVITRKPTESEGALAYTGGAVRDRPGRGAEAFMAVVSKDKKNPSRFVFAASAERINRSKLSVPETSPAFDVFDGETSRRDFARPASVFASGELALGEIGSLSILALHQRADYNSEFGDISALSHNARIAMGNTFGRLQLEIPFEIFGGKGNWKTHVAGTRGSNLDDEVLDTGSSIGSIVYRQRKNRAYSAGSELSWDFLDQFVLLGVDYEEVGDEGDTLFQQGRDAADPLAPSDRTLRVVGTPLDYTNLGVYGQLLSQPHESLSLTVGARYDRNSLWQNNTSLRAAAAYRATERLAFKLLYGTSFVPPAPAQLTSNPIRPGGVVGNLELLPQRAGTAEAEASYSIPGLLSVRLTGFRTRVVDRVEFVLTSVNPTSRNLSTSTTFGSELGMELQAEPFFVRGNFSYQTSSIEGPDPLPLWWNSIYGDGTEGLLPSYPGMQGHWTVGARSERLHVLGSMTLHHASKRVSSFSNTSVAGGPYTIDGYATVDVHLRSLDLGTYGGVSPEVELTVRNVLDRRYAEPGALGVDIPALGRSVFGTVTLRF